MTLTAQPVRCSRCAGSGDIPLIAEDAFVYPDRKPLLECCPDCGGTGMLRLGEVEIYSLERKAEFLLNTAVDDEDRAAARKEVKRMRKRR